MSIRRAPTAAKRSSSDAAAASGFGITQSGAIGFAEDLMDGSGEMTMTRSSIQQRQVIADLQQKLEKLSTTTTTTAAASSASATSDESSKCITNNRDAFSRICHSSWPLLPTGENINIEKFQIYDPSDVKKAVSNIWNNKKVIKSQISRIMLIYTYLRNHYDVTTKKWDVGYDGNITFKTLKEKTTSKEGGTSTGKEELFLYDIFVTFSEKSKKWKKWLYTFERDDNIKHLERFTDINTERKQRNQQVIDRWMENNTVSLEDKEIKKLVPIIMDLEKSGQDASKWIDKIHKEFIWSTSEEKWIHPKWNEHRNYQVNGTNMNMKVGTLYKAANLWECADMFMEAEKSTREAEIEVNDMLSIPKPPPAEAPPSLQKKPSFKNVAGNGDTVMKDTSGQKSKGLAMAFTGNHYHDGKYKKHGGHDGKEKHHRHYYNKEEDEEDETRSAFYCNCANPIAVPIVNKNNFCTCEDPIPIQTSAVDKPDDQARIAEYGWPKGWSM